MGGESQVHLLSVALRTVPPFPRTDSQALFVPERERLLLGREMEEQPLRIHSLGLVNSEPLREAVAQRTTKRQAELEDSRAIPTTSSEVL